MRSAPARQPHINWGLAIRDVRARQMEGIGVEVENSDAAIAFFARDVTEPPDPE